MKNLHSGLLIINTILQDSIRRGLLIPDHGFINIYFIDYSQIMMGIYFFLFAFTEVLIENHHHPAVLNRKSMIDKLKSNVIETHLHKLNHPLGIGDHLFVAPTLPSPRVQLVG